MKRILCIFFILAGRLHAQSFDLKLDTVIAKESLYNKRFKLWKIETGGEGFELLRSSKLRHAFFSDRPGNPYRQSGAWTMMNDSIVLFISNKKLVTKYKYNKRESYRPISLSWDLSTNLKNNKNKLLVFKNKLIVLNKAGDPNELLNQLRVHTTLTLDKLKTGTNPEDPFYYFELNEKIINEMFGFLYEKKLFESIETARVYD